MPIRGSGSLEALFAPFPPTALTSPSLGAHALSADMYYDNLTLTGGVVELFQFGLFVRGTLTLADGVILRPRTLGNGGTNAAGTGGAAGAARPAGTTGGSNTNAGGGGTGGVGAFANTPAALGLFLGGGGGGGSGGSQGAGGGGGLAGFDGGGGGAAPSTSGSGGGLTAFHNQAGAPFPAFGDILSIQALLTGHLPIFGVNYPIYGGGGGGGGGADAVPGPSRGGGGGGGGGGVVRILANRIVRSGVGVAPRIEALGGDGGTGDGNPAASASPGPGGGGGGGVILIGYGSIDPTIVLSVAGGGAGQPANYAGSPKFGGAGATGRIFRWEL